MVEVHGAYKHGWYEKKTKQNKNTWLNSLCEMSTFKVFAKEDGRTNTTHYIDPYDTHMDQEKDTVFSPLTSFMAWFLQPP